MHKSEVLRQAELYINHTLDAHLLGIDRYGYGKQMVTFSKTLLGENYHV